jgi:uncharacterized protein YdiU (UPF0061 family)
MTIFFQLLIDFPVEEDKPGVLNHFKESFYNALTVEEEALLNEVMNSYSERIKSNVINRQESIVIMQESNPRFILRNYLLHNAIEALEKGEETLFLQLQQAMKEPYSKKFDEFFVKRPSWATQKAGCSMLSCSS